MKFKQLVIMVVIAAVLGGAAWFLNKKDGAKTSSGMVAAAESVPRSLICR
jgi:Flp pilus assembly protein CpaB